MLKSFCVDRTSLSKDEDEELYISLLEASENGAVKLFSDYSDVDAEHRFMGVCIGRVFLHNSSDQFRNNIVSAEDAKEILCAYS